MRAVRPCKTKAVYGSYSRFKIQDSRFKIQDTVRPCKTKAVATLTFIDSLKPNIGRVMALRQNKIQYSRFEIRSFEIQDSRFEIRDLGGGGRVMASSAASDISFVMP